MIEKHSPLFVLFGLNISAVHFVPRPQAKGNSFGQYCNVPDWGKEKQVQPEAVVSKSSALLLASFLQNPGGTVVPVTTTSE